MADAVPRPDEEHEFGRDGRPGGAHLREARDQGGVQGDGVAKGVAIGVASAFPDSVATIARWAEAAQTRGIMLVPASAAVATETDG